MRFPILNFNWLFKAQEPAPALAPKPEAGTQKFQMLPVAKGFYDIGKPMHPSIMEERIRKAAKQS